MRLLVAITINVAREFYLLNYQFCYGFCSLTWNRTYNNKNVKISCSVHVPCFGNQVVSAGLESISKMLVANFWTKICWKSTLHWSQRQTHRMQFSAKRFSLGHLCPDLEQIATEFVFAWLVSIYSLVFQKKNSKEIYVGKKFDWFKIWYLLRTPLINLV